MTSRQQLAFYNSFSQHGSGNAQVVINPQDVILLVHIAYFDVYENEADWFMQEFKLITQLGFYSITPDVLDKLSKQSVENAIRFIEMSGAINPQNVIYLYLKNLSELFRRRFKYYRILKSQPFPEVDQIGPRCLLEYGNCNDDLLFSWMRWRKLIYDIDNRSAQETGYLFEPIIASCLGGEPKSHHNSPIKRLANNDEPTNEGRQIDCLVDDTQTVYELKLRVTIAASGQGRFAEELSFPKEAQHAGFKPILIVFDPTPSTLLCKLKEMYINHGGECAVGEAAWALLSEKAGAEMGKYILKYIKPAISKMEDASTQLPSGISLNVTQNQLIIRNEAGDTYTIPRSAVDTPSTFEY